jgi:hypothetical protein
MHDKAEANAGATVTCSGGWGMRGGQLWLGQPSRSCVEAAGGYEECRYVRSRQTELTAATAQRLGEASAQCFFWRLAARPNTHRTKLWV